MGDNLNGTVLTPRLSLFFVVFQRCLFIPRLHGWAARPDRPGPRPPQEATQGVHWPARIIVSLYQGVEATQTREKRSGWEDRKQERKTKKQDFLCLGMPGLPVQSGVTSLTTACSCSYGRIRIPERQRSSNWYLMGRNTLQQPHSVPRLQVCDF